MALRYSIIALVLGMGLLSVQEQKPPKTSEELGKALFFDPILSEDQTLSCASCHIPQFAFADTARVSKGVHHQLGTRNAPALNDLAQREHFFWDGRANSLEEQVLQPITNPIEMNLSLEQATQRLASHPIYKKAFLKIFKSQPTSHYLAQALADYVRTLETSSPFDSYMKTGEHPLFTPSAKRGHALFLGKAKCFDCHFGPDFTNDEFRAIGLYDEKNYTDKGRFEVTKKESDKGKFRVAPLRNIALTAPYMHDGSLKTLKEVIAYYNTPNAFVPHAINRDTLLAQPLGLTEIEQQDLEAFLKTLTDPKFLK